MATNYPATLDGTANVGGGVEPEAVTALDDSTSGHPTHSGLHQNLGDAVQQLETKVGVGASTPSANQVLACASGSTSTWSDSPAVANLTLSGTLNGVDPDNFANMTDSTGAGRKITVKASPAPTSPSVGDLWVEIA